MNHQHHQHHPASSSIISITSVQHQSRRLLFWGLGLGWSNRHLPVCCLRWKPVAFKGVFRTKLHWKGIFKREGSPETFDAFLGVSPLLSMGSKQRETLTLTVRTALAPQTLLMSLFTLSLNMWFIMSKVTYEVFVNCLSQAI